MGNFLKEWQPDADTRMVKGHVVRDRVSNGKALLAACYAVVIAAAVLLVTNWPQ